MNPRPLTILICGVLLASAQLSWARKWTDTTGKFTVEAELVEVKADNVVLKKKSGSLITLPLARLSENDRQYLQDLQALPQEPTNPPVSPGPEVIAAWKEAGAEFSPEVEGVPLFRFKQFPTGGLEALPPPEVPFGLSFQSVTDADLKELSKLTQLHSLDLWGSQVTDAGLKELGGLTQLKSLNLWNTKVTDAGLKELGGMKQLQLLNLFRTMVPHWLVD